MDSEVSLGREMDLPIELSGSDCLARTVHNGSGKKVGRSQFGKKRVWPFKHTDGPRIRYKAKEAVFNLSSGLSYGGLLFCPRAAAFNGGSAPVRPMNPTSDLSGSLKGL